MKKELPKFEILFFIYVVALIMTPFLSNANYVNGGFLATNIVIGVLSRKFIFKQRVEGKLLIAFFALAAVVTVLAPLYIGTTTITAWGQETFFMGTGIMVVANCYFIVSRCDAKKILRGFQYGSIPFLIWGIVEFIQRDNPIRQIFAAIYFYGDWDVETSMYRIRTLFYHPIIYGVFQVVIWCIFLYFPFKNKVADIVCKLLVILNLLATQSRSSWVSFAVVNVFYILVWAVALIRKKEEFPKATKSDKVIYGVMSSGAVAALIWKWDFVLAQIAVLKQRMAGVFTLNIELSSNPVRLINIRNVFNFVKELDNPPAVMFGHGYGYDKLYMQEHPVYGWSDAVDNQYLTNLLDYGVAGFVLFLLLVAVLVVKYVKYGRQQIYGACILAALSFLVSTFFYEGLCNMVPLILFSSMVFGEKKSDIILPKEE